MKTGDKVIVMYAVVPAEKWDDIKMPKGTYAKAFNVGGIEDLLEAPACRQWGAMMAAGIHKLAKALCPDQARVLSILGPHAK